MVKRVRLILVGVLVLLLGGCGGGGGGNNSKNGSASTGVRILHGNIDAAPLDMFSSLGGAEDSGPISARFAEPRFYGELKKGVQELLIHERFNSNDLRFTFPVTVEKRQHYSVLLYGDLEQFGPRATLLLDEPPEDIPEEQIAVRVVHALIGAGTVSSALGGSVIASDVTFGGAGFYQLVSATATNIQFVRGVDGRVVYSGAMAFAPGRAYTVMITGEVDYLVTATQYED